ncbi:hypothetical protein A4R44_08561 [Amycolatopsis sp. M39]|nr:hypothetical protein A4R44_08561 [Amycolatopsis sp. M39]
MVQACGDPMDGSIFANVNELYPHEKVSDRVRHYVEAAFEHLLMWADNAAPLKFHPEQTVNFTLRPTYTLARAALESSAQAVWILSANNSKECVRRHLSLIRWDIQEHKKSSPSPEHKEACRTRENELLARVGSVFTEQDVKPPNGYLAVLKSACEPNDLDLEPVGIERLWRAASGAAHGMYWPNLELQTLTTGNEDERGHFRAQRLPDSTVMVEVIQSALKMSQYAAYKYVVLSGLDLSALVGPAMRWLTSNMTLKPDADPELLKQLNADRPPNWGME